MFRTKRVENTLEVALRQKMSSYNPEPSHMPFHTRLLGKDRMALFSFIQSLNTNFGTAIFEKVAEQIAIGEFDEVSLQYKLSGVLSSDAQAEITNIMNGLSAGSRSPNHAVEIEQISRQAQSGELIKKNMRKVDIFLTKEDSVYLVDLKTAKPNMAGFEKYKQDMLEWASTILYTEPDKNVRVVIAIPYNPYEPKPYRRWTLRGMLEVENQSQLMVGNEFWNFLAGGQDIYEDLLGCFESVGYRLRDEIDAYFKRFTGIGGRQT